ncbi:hypothetical protein C0993_004592, partial [Termitomyces sp. T159_Od127]
GPTHLKKELDTVLALQGNLDTCKKTLRATRQTLAKTTPSSCSLRILMTLQEHHEQLKDGMEELYTSLSLQDSFPELCGVDLEFVQTLLAIRRWLHQATQAAIKKRAPALMAGLQKYNDLCATLASLHKPEWSIPLPEPLPTELKPLCDAPNLMQDVWISRPMEEALRWLMDKRVQEGIWALLKVDRCLEEQRRLIIEADNLCRWFGCEFAAIELALSDPATSKFLFANIKTFDHLIQKASNIVQSFVTSHVSSHVLDSISHRCTTVEEYLEEQFDGEEPLQIQDDANLRTPEDLLISDYLFCEEDVEVLDESSADSNIVITPGVDVKTVWTFPPCMSLHKHLIQELQFQTFQEFAPLSTNAFDCGVWMIANIAAILSGFSVTGVQEQDIIAVRHSLFQILAALPVYTSTT